MNSLDPQSREVLRAGQAGEGPSPQDRERLRQKLAVAIAAGVAGPAMAAPPAAAKWWASRTVVGSAGLVSAVVVGVTAVVVSRSSDRPPEPPPVVAPMPEAPPSSPVAELVEAPAEEPEIEPVAQPTKVSTKKKRTPVKPTRTEPSPPPPVVVTAPAALVEPTPDELEAETQGLKEVQLALRAKEPQRALTLLDEQDRRFARGQLRQEREGARVLAVCATDPVAGNAAFERFRVAHPASPLLARLKGACTR